MSIHPAAAGLLLWARRAGDIDWLPLMYCGWYCVLLRSLTYQGPRNCLLDGAKILLPSVLWCCWLGGRKGIRRVKKWVVGYWRGYRSGARCRLAYGPADAMPLPISCFIKIQIGYTFLVPAHPGSPGKRAVKWVCVCQDPLAWRGRFWWYPGSIYSTLFARGTTGWCHHLMPLT